ncbi:MAG: ATP-binding protein [Candidatus Aminicenantes bacterium]
MKVKRFKSLTFKLTVWYIIILGVIVVLAGLFLYQGFKERLMDDLDKVLMEIADETNEKWRKKKGVTWKDAIQHAEASYSSHEPFIQLVQLAENRERQVERIIRSDRIPEGAFQLKTHLYYRADKSDFDSLVFATVCEENLSSFPLRVFLLPVRGPNVLQVGISVENVAGSLNQLMIVMVAAGLMLLVFASLGGSLIIRKALQPVKSVVQTANEITTEDLSLRIDVKNRQDEIGALVKTFNDMIIRLEKSVNKIRQFSGDVSHELRTPLTIIRGEIEVLLRKKRTEEEYMKTLKSALEESSRMEKIIDDLLFLSRAEALDKSKFNKTVQLDEIVANVVKIRNQPAVNKGLTIIAEKVKPAKVKGNKELLERMITNVIDNAIRYTPSGGRIEVLLTKSQDKIQLEIRDTGIGIPDESLPYIYDRFYVVDKSRSRETGGAGLGLSIVKWISDHHRAEIEVKSKENQGTSFIIKFPLFEPKK